MECVGYIAGIAVGLVLGLYFGRLLNAIIVYWESTTTATKAYKSAIGFILGAGGGAVIFGLFSGHHAAFYLIGLAIGMVITFFWPRIPSRCDPSTIKLIVNLNEAMRKNIPDVEQRITLIISAIKTPKSIEREEKISEETLAKKLEEATDAYQDVGLEVTDELSNEGSENGL